MTTKAKVLLGIGTVVVLIGAAAGAALLATANLPKAADAFFSRIAEGNATAAYQSTAREFRAQTSEAEFLQFLKTTSLTDYQTASWSSRSIENDRGTLEGTITTKSGGKIPLTIKLIKEGGSWQIYHLNIPTGGLGRGNEESPPALPSEAEAKQLARESLLSFYQAVAKKDFTAFYASTSSIWQKQTTAAALQNTFRPFAAVNMTMLLDLVTKPIGFTKAPTLNEDNFLVLEGQTPEGAKQPPLLTFELLYHSARGQWKLVGIHVNL